MIKLQNVIEIDPSNLGEEDRKLCDKYFPEMAMGQDTTIAINTEMKDFSEEEFKKFQSILVDKFLSPGNYKQKTQGITEEDLDEDTLVTLNYKGCAVDSPHKSVMENIRSTQETLSKSRKKVESWYQREINTFNSLRFTVEKVGGVSKLEGNLRQEFCDCIACIVVLEYVLKGIPIPIIGINGKAPDGNDVQFSEE